MNTATRNGGPACGCPSLRRQRADGIWHGARSEVGQPRRSRPRTLWSRSLSDGASRYAVMSRGPTSPVFDRTRRTTEEALSELPGLPLT